MRSSSRLPWFTLHYSPSPSTSPFRFPRQPPTPGDPSEGTADNTELCSRQIHGARVPTTWKRLSWPPGSMKSLALLIQPELPEILLLHLVLGDVCAQSCLTLCDPMDCSPPGSSVHGILQARILEQIAISFSRGSSWPRDWTLDWQILYHCITWKDPLALGEKVSKVFCAFLPRSTPFPTPLSNIIGSVV